MASGGIRYGGALVGRPGQSLTIQIAWPCEGERIEQAEVMPSAVDKMGYLDTTIAVMPRSSITAQSVAEHIRREICSGSLAPGSALRQEALAAGLGVSRMPVRDAIQMLQAEGLVHVLPNRGAFVATMTQAECAEIFDLRVLLECDALTHAVPRHTEASLRKLKRLQRDLEEEAETAAWAEGDRLFHETLYAPCERPRTLQMIATLRNAVERFYLAKLTHGTHRRGWKAEHRGVLDETARGDVAHACRRLTEHLRETQNVVARTI